MTEGAALRRRLLWGSAVVTLALIALVVAGITGSLPFTAITWVCVLACCLAAGFGWTRYVQLRGQN